MRISGPVRRKPSRSSIRNTHTGHNRLSLPFLICDLWSMSWWVSLQFPERDLPLLWMWSNRQRCQRWMSAARFASCISYPHAHKHPHMHACNGWHFTSHQFINLFAAIIYSNILIFVFAWLSDWSPMVSARNAMRWHHQYWQHESSLWWRVSSVFSFDMKYDPVQCTSGQLLSGNVSREKMYLL